MFERVSRKEAMASGRSRYFEGKPCKYGHVAERSTVSCNCCACTILHAGAKRRANPDARKAYYAKHKEVELATNRAYIAANRARVLALAKKNRGQKADALRVQRAEWRKANPQYAAQHKAANPDLYRVYRHTRRARQGADKLSPEIVAKLYESQRGRCACCEMPLGDDYHLDHIMPLALGGTNTDDNIQLLRRKCNSQKGGRHPVEFMQQQRGKLL